MDVFCEIHGPDPTLEDFSTGDIICMQCGLVLAERAVSEQPDWKMYGERCIIEDPEKRKIMDRLKTEYSNSAVQIKKYKIHHERFIDLFFEKHNVEAYIQTEVKNNFLTFKKQFSNVDLELLMCAVIFYTLEINGCIISLPQILDCAPRFSKIADSSVVNRILKFKRKMEDGPLTVTNVEECVDRYFLNFTEKLSIIKIIPKNKAAIFLNSFKEMRNTIMAKIHVNSKRPLQTSAVLAIYYVLETKLQPQNPRDLLKVLCNIAGVRDNSITYWMQQINSKASCATRPESESRMPSPDLPNSS